MAKTKPPKKPSAAKRAPQKSISRKLEKMKNADLERTVGGINYTPKPWE